MHPPQAEDGRDAAFFQGATGGNQNRQVRHIKQDRRQQFEEAALARVHARQRHRHQGHDEHQQRQRQAPLQFRVGTGVVAGQQGAGGDGFTFAEVFCDFRLGQHDPVGVVLDGAVVGLAGRAVVAVTVVEDQVAGAVGAYFLAALLGHQHGDAGVFLVRRHFVTLGDEHPAEVDAVVGQGLGVGHPRAVAQHLEAAGDQGVELGHRILLVDHFHPQRHALGRQAQAQPGDDRADHQRRAHGDAQQALLAHAGGSEHGHLAFQVEAPVGQQNAEEQAQRQDQLEEARQAVAHDLEQHARIEQALRRLGEVFDETAAHDDDQQHRADGTHGQHDLAGEITEDDQTRHSRVVGLRQPNN